MGNKMFVIGGFDTTSSEVFENFPKKFVKLNSEIKFSDFDKYIYALSIGNNIIVFQVALSKTVVYLYDVDKEKWLKIQCDFPKSIFESSYVKYYT